MTTVSLGICTFSRPEYAERCTKAIVRHCSNVVDQIYIYDDGSDKKFHGAYQRAFKPIRAIGGVVVEHPENLGTASAKNELLGMALDDGADWLLLAEDDQIVQSPSAVTEYIRIAEATGSHHFSFAHHGPANLGGPVDIDGEVEFFPHSVGAWTLFSRECLESVGLFDPHFRGAWDHVEHELRLIQAGFMPSAAVHRFPDIAGSANLIKEIPGSIEKSSIRPRADWATNIRDGLIYWSTEKPETFAMLFGPDMPLHAYAQSIIG